MAEAFYVVLVMLLILALVGIDALRRGKRRRFILREKMPTELIEAQLVHSEHYIRTFKPRKMHGALDQLYRLVTGFHVLVDTKTRDKHRIYRKDIVQLSIYRVILEKMGYKMERYAYFRVVTPNGVEYMQADLLTEETVVLEYDRTQALINGDAEPTIAQHKGMCQNCPQQINCDEWQFSGRQTA